MLRIESPLPAAHERMVTRVVDCAFAVHSELGPGFREKIYKRAFCLELESRALSFECEKRIEVNYKGWRIPGQQVDLIVAGIVLVEIKTVPRLTELHRSQVRSYLKTMGLQIGLLANFNTELIKRGLRRVVVNSR